MTPCQIIYSVNRSSETDIFAHLQSCDHQFNPLLSERVNLAEYAHKIKERAYAYEAWDGTILVGLVAAYVNTAERSCYITNVSVLAAYGGKGIAAQLMTDCLDHCHSTAIGKVSLEVANDNQSAIRLYEKFGLKIAEHRGNYLFMQRIMNPKGNEL